MPAYARHELKYARPLAAGTIYNGPFRAWLSGRDDLAEATHDPLLQSRLRTPNMKNPYWYNYWCGTCWKSDNPYGCMSRSKRLASPCSMDKRRLIHAALPVGPMPHGDPTPFLPMKTGGRYSCTTVMAP